MKKIKVIIATITAMCHCSLKGNTANVVDARCYAVQALSKYYTDTEIANEMGMTRQGVNRLKNTFELMRKRYGFSEQWTEIQQAINSQSTSKE